MKDLFVFPLNKDKYFNYELLNTVEDKEFKYLNDEEIEVLLKWINKRIIDVLPKKLETLEGCCGYAADLLDILLNKLNIGHYSFNINYLLKERKLVHVITLIKILTNNNEYKDFILDPTFRQFLQTSKCIPNKKNKEGKNQGKSKIIYPGYFLSLTEEKIKFGTDLLNNGYFLLNENNLKMYCEAFIKYKNTCYFRDINYNIDHKQNYINQLHNCLPHSIYELNEKLKKELQNTPKQLKLVRK